MIAFNENDLILISGASTGIERATALLCNELGAKVIAVARTRENLEALKNEAKFPENILIESRDLSQNLEELPDWVTELRKQYGKFSGFVHCAGYNTMAPFKCYDLKDAEKMFNIHFHAGMLLARGVTDRRNAQKPCSCVFISSICTVTALRMLTIYASAKGALLGAVKCMSKELSTQGIRVNCVSPALVRTPLTENYSNVVMGYDVLGKEDEIYPLGISEPIDIANSIVFLLSKASAKITGQNIIIDGGRH